MLEQMGGTVRRAVRAVGASDGTDRNVVAVGDLAQATDWTHALEGVDSVVHLAARVHLPGDNNLEAFRHLNTDATLRLAAAAARAQVRRFVYVSTAKVMGEASRPGHPFTESDPPGPADSYARSKFDAETGLRKFAGVMEIAIVRPPLVYGPGVGANFLRLLRWVDRGRWLPLGAVTNRRSLIYVGNLASAIGMCVRHPDAAGATFLVSDGEDLSTSDLIRRTARALGKTARCWPVPPAILWTAGSAMGRREEARRLLGSLEIDSRLIRNRLNWVPPYSVDEGLGATADWFRQEASRYEDSTGR
jgi:nucleoside-diphosphate-sugar epimerase